MLISAVSIRFGSSWTLWKLSSAYSLLLIYHPRALPQDGIMNRQLLSDIRFYYSA